MSFSGLDPAQHLSWIAQTEACLRMSEKGKVYIYPELPQGRAAEIYIQAEQYRILVTVFIGPRGGVTEQVTVLDDGQKEHEIDHLYLVQVAQGSRPGGEGLVTPDIGRGTPIQKLEKAKTLLEAEFAKATADPAAYAHRIEMFRHTETTGGGGWTLMVPGGLPRT